MQNRQIISRVLCRRRCLGAVLWRLMHRCRRQCSESVPCGDCLFCITEAFENIVLQLPVQPFGPVFLCPVHRIFIIRCASGRFYIVRYRTNCDFSMISYYCQVKIGGRRHFLECIILTVSNTYIDAGGDICSK